MCGLFGTARPDNFPGSARTRAAAAVVDLGELAEERGVDSAGLATLHTRRPIAVPLAAPLGVRSVIAGHWRVTTALGRFTKRMLDDPLVRSNLRTARTVIGHTRWATQGAATLANASPMLVGDVVGTHNGDVTVPRPLGGRTDSAWLFSQLDHAGSAKAAAAVLAAARGRAALVWTRRDQPGQLFLARAAISPLAVATDATGALWWASNPQWLRAVDRRHQLGMTDPVLLPEGTFLQVRTPPEQIEVVRQVRFLPTCRRRDQQLADLVAWRGFTNEDRATDLAQQHHRVAADQSWAVTADRRAR